MSTRRSARIRAASASASQSIAIAPQDENNNAQLCNRKPKETLPTGKRRARKQDAPQKPSQPLQDVTNNVPNTRSRRLQKTVPKRNLEKNNEIISVRPRKKPRQCNQPLQLSVSSQEASPPNSPTGKTHSGRTAEKATENRDDEIVLTPPRRRTRQSKQPPQTLKRHFHKVPTDLPNETTRLNAVAEESSSDEIRPNPPRRSPGIKAPAPESLSEDIRTNASMQCRREPLVLTQSSDEAQPGPVRIRKPSVVATGQSPARPSSPAIRGSPPMSPLSTRKETKTHRTLWPNENRDPNSTAFDMKRPRQAVHTYGKRRRVARVSLPTMQALGVRAKSPSSGSQGSDEKEEGYASEEYQESDDESEDTPTQDPKLEAFLAEQKRLWQEVDETDLLVESD